MLIIIDSLFNGNIAEVDELPFIPFSGKDSMEIEAKIITKNEVEIPAFEVRIPYQKLYNGMVKKYYANKWNSSMKVGDIREGTTSGTWDN